MKTSEKIRQRLKEKEVRFHSNDNIAEYIEKGEIEELQKEVEDSFSGVLDALVIDTENDHNTKETARRVAKMYMQEIFAGRFVNPPKVTSFPNMGYRSLYTSGPISGSPVFLLVVQPIFRSAVQTKPKGKDKAGKPKRKEKRRKRRDCI